MSAVGGYAIVMEAATVPLLSITQHRPDATRSRVVSIDWLTAVKFSPIPASSAYAEWRSAVSCSASASVYGRGESVDVIRRQ